MTIQNKQLTRGRPKAKGVATKEFGDVAYLVRNARLGLGLSLAEIALRTGNSTQFICNIEKGRAPIPTKSLGIFAIALGLQKVELVNVVIRAKAIEMLHEAEGVK